MHVSSPRPRKPKKANAIAAQIINESKFRVLGIARNILNNFLEVVLDEVPLQSEFKTKLTQIQCCNSEAELLVLVNSFLERFDMGYTKPVLTLKDKDDLIRFCSEHIVISSVAEEIFSFYKGLSTFGVLPELCKFFQAGLAELVHQEVNAEDVKSCFKPCFPPVSTDEHDKETEIVYKWQKFLKKAKEAIRPESFEHQSAAFCYCFSCWQWIRVML